VAQPYLCVVLCCLVLSCLVLSCVVLCCLVLSRLVLAWLVLASLSLACLGLSCLILSYLDLSCSVLSRLVYERNSGRAAMLNLIWCMIVEHRLGWPSQERGSPPPPLTLTRTRTRTRTRTLIARLLFPVDDIIVSSRCDWCGNNPSVWAVNVLQEWKAF
jgi:hypothetical protein